MRKPAPTIDPALMLKQGASKDCSNVENDLFVDPKTSMLFGECESRSEKRVNAKPMKQPGADHPIIIERNPARVVVKIAGKTIADSREALTLREASYPGVQYIPRKDADMSQLERTHHSTYCPYKGDCSYFSIPLGGERSVNAVWTYESPYPAVAAIKDHLAFYPSRVDAIEEIR